MKKHLLRLNAMLLLLMAAVAAKADQVTATWDFHSADGNYYAAGSANIQGATGTLDATASDGSTVTLTVDATNSGKLYSRGGGDAQFNNGTIIKVPVKSANDVVTVVSYPNYHHYTVGGAAAEADETSHTASAAEAKAGFVEIIATNTAYLYSIKVELKPATEGPVLTEKSIYSTDFSDWEAVKASTSETKVAKQTKYSEETLTFGIYNTAVMSTDDTKFGSYTTLPHMALQAQKAATPYVTTSPLASITKVRFVHGATGGNRGWKLEAKGDGDKDWVVVSDAVANPAGWSEVTKDINKTNCQLRFTNLTSNQNAYMFELEIFGMVDLSGDPMLGSFKANGQTYTGEAFEMDNNGNYVADIELFKSETMISESNALTDVKADNGELGTITYVNGTDNCKVTIPVTANGKTINYIANFVRKPFFTLTYVGTSGETIGTQQVEKDTKITAFAYDIAEVAATKDGYKARGWFKQNYVGEKYTTASVITANASLYAVETEIEESSDSRKYVFDLTKATFYAEDHEAFNVIGNGHYHNNHGWIFGSGDAIQVLVGKKASISLGLCAYSNDAMIDASNGQSISAKVDTDGALGAFSYEGEAGTLTLTFRSTAYVHSVTILNTTTTNYTKEGNTFNVKEGDGSSFLDALDAANGESGSDPVTIYLPNGTYDLGNACLSTIGRNNITIKGESQSGVIIQNRPTAEGIGTTATLLNTSQYLTLENLTLKNLYPYYDPKTGKAAASAGRAVCLQDKGNYTVCKNVTMLSYQDTYYSNNSNGYFYFVDCDIHGLVDFVCGGGDVFFENTLFTLESRETTEGKGDVTIAAPNGAKKVGYVMDHCTVDCHSATFNWGRSWGAFSGLVWMNTTLKQPSKLVSSRFTVAGMNSSADAFYEYNTVDQSGNVLTPASKIIEFTHETGNKKYETILTAAEASNYTKEKVFEDAPDEFKTRIGYNKDTGITTVTPRTNDADNAIYDMRGVRVKNATKGIYIIGNKKVLVK
ncbi:MAG: pectin esterase [Prevotella sp.]|nr:pectin esterase [Prevotella sp.]